MTSVPPPPGPTDPQSGPPGPPPQHAQFAPPGGPSAAPPPLPPMPPAHQYGAPQPSQYAPPQPHEYAPSQPVPGPGGPWGSPTAPPGQHAQPWGAPQQWQQSPQGSGNPGIGYPAPGQPGPPGQPGAYAQQGLYAAPSPYAPQGQYAPPSQDPQQSRWGAPQPEPSGRSKTSVIAFSVVGAIVVVGLAVAAFIMFSSSDVEALPKDVDATTSAHARELSVGNCLASLPSGGEVAEVTVVPCADTHDAQVVAGKKLSGDDFPGDAKVIERTTAICPGRSITADSAPQALDFLVWTPSEESWDEGDRQGLCVASSPDEPLTGSLIR